MLLKNPPVKANLKQDSFILETYFKETDLTFSFLYSLYKSSDHFHSGNRIQDVPLLRQKNLTIFFWTILSFSLW